MNLRFVDLHTHSVQREEAEILRLEDEALDQAALRYRFCLKASECSSAELSALRALVEDEAWTGHVLWSSSDSDFCRRQFLAFGDRSHMEDLARMMKNADALRASSGSVSELLSRGENDRPLVWRCRDRHFDLSAGATIMGILNVTPDSFSDGGRFNDADRAVEHASRMAAAGAGIIDIGGESTRPGSESVPVDEETRRVVPVVERIAASLDVAISVDTTKAQVARAALDFGAHIVNDISALRFDPEMAHVVSDYSTGLVLMHMLGAPETMQQDPHYEDVTTEVIGFLRERAQYALASGIAVANLCIDPGIGFGKKLRDNFVLLRRLAEMACLGLPIMVGPSRKSFIGKSLGLPVDQRVEATLGAVVASVRSGAHIVRVHDVEAVHRAVALVDMIDGNVDMPELA